MFRRPSALSAIHQRAAHVLWPRLVHVPRSLPAGRNWREWQRGLTRVTLPCLSLAPTNAPCTPLPRVPTRSFWSQAPLERPSDEASKGPGAKEWGELDRVAREFVEKEDYKSAYENWREALEIHGKEIGRDDEDAYRMMCSAASAVACLGLHKEAASLFKEALQIVAPYGEGEDVAHCKSYLGAALLASGDYSGAQASLEEALRVLTRLTPEDDSDVIVCLSYLSQALGLQFKYEESLPILKRLLTFREQNWVDGTYDEDLVDILQSTALVSRELKAEEEAIQLHLRVLDMAENYGDGRLCDVGREAMYGVAQSFLSKDNGVGAESMLKELIEYESESEKIDHTHMVKNLLPHLSSSYAIQGKVAECDNVLMHLFEYLNTPVSELRNYKGSGPDEDEGLIVNSNGPLYENFKEGLDMTVGVAVRMASVRLTAWRNLQEEAGSDVPQNREQRRATKRKEKEAGTAAGGSAAPTGSTLASLQDLNGVLERCHAILCAEEIGRKELLDLVLGALVEVSGVLGNADAAQRWQAALDTPEEA